MLLSLLTQESLLAGASFAIIAKDVEKTVSENKENNKSQNQSITSESKQSTLQNTDSKQTSSPVSSVVTSLVTDSAPKIADVIKENIDDSIIKSFDSFKDIKISELGINSEVAKTLSDSVAKYSAGASTVAATVAPYVAAIGACVSLVAVGTNSISGLLNAFHFTEQNLSVSDIINPFKVAKIFAKPSSEEIKKHQSQVNFQRYITWINNNKSMFNNFANLTLNDYKQAYFMLTNNKFDPNILLYCQNIYNQHIGEMMKYFLIDYSNTFDFSNDYMSYFSKFGVFLSDTLDNIQYQIRYGEYVIKGDTTISSNIDINNIYKKRFADFLELYNTNRSVSKAIYNVTTAPVAQTTSIENINKTVMTVKQDSNSLVAIVAISTI